VTVTLNFKPDIEAGLLAQAQASGMTVEEYLLSMVEGVVLPATQKARSPEQRAAAFEARSANHRPTPPLSDYAVSRKVMYEGSDRRCAFLSIRIFCRAVPSQPTLSARKPPTPSRRSCGFLPFAERRRILTGTSCTVKA
jgi:hypothetical protein